MFNTIINNNKVAQPNIHRHSNRHSNRSSAKLNVTSREKVQSRNIDLDKTTNRFTKYPNDTDLNKTKDNQILARAEPIVS